MNRKILLFVFLFCILLFASAQDISMEGFGITVEDAKINAKENLSRYINGEYFSSKTSVSISETQKTGAEGSSFTSNSSLSSESDSVSLGFLRAVEFVNEKKDAMVWTARRRRG